MNTLTKNGTATDKKAEVKNVTTSIPVKPDEKKNLPVKIATSEERLKKLEQFNMLAERYESLKGRRDELQKFLIAKDGNKEELTIKSFPNREFKVGNSDVIREVSQLISKRLDEKIAETETEVLSFQI